MALKKPGLLENHLEVLLAVLSGVAFLLVCLFTLTSIDYISQAESEEKRAEFVEWYNKRTKESVPVKEPEDYADVLEKLTREQSDVRGLEDWLFYQRLDIRVSREPVTAYYLGRIKIAAEGGFGIVTVKVNLLDLGNKYNAEDPQTQQMQPYSHVNEDKVKIYLFSGRYLDGKIVWMDKPFELQNRTGPGQWVFEHEIGTTGREERYYWARATAEFPDAKTMKIDPATGKVIESTVSVDDVNKIQGTYVRAETKPVYKIKFNGTKVGTSIGIDAFDNSKPDTPLVRENYGAGNLIEGTPYKILNIVEIRPDSIVQVDRNGVIILINIKLDVYNYLTPDEKKGRNINVSNSILSPKSNTDMIAEMERQVREKFLRLPKPEGASFHPRRQPLLKYIVNEAVKIAGKAALLDSPRNVGNNRLDRPIKAYTCPIGPWKGSREMLAREVPLSLEHGNEALVVYLAPSDNKDKALYWAVHVSPRGFKGKFNEVKTGPYEIEIGEARTSDAIFAIVQKDALQKLNDDMLTASETAPDLVSTGQAKYSLPGEAALFTLTGIPSGWFIHYYDGKAQKSYINSMPERAVVSQATTHRPRSSATDKEILDKLGKTKGLGRSSIGPRNIEEFAAYVEDMWGLKGNVHIDPGVKEIESIMGISFVLEFEDKKTTGAELLDRVIDRLNELLEERDLTKIEYSVKDGKIIIEAVSAE